MKRPMFLGQLVVTIAVLTFALVPSSASAQQDVSALKAEVDRLRSEIEGLKSEVRLIREMLLQRLAQPAQPAAPAPPPRVVANVSIAGGPVLGNPDAPITMVEFSDYQCPFCRRFFDTTLPTLKKEYIESGKVRYVFRDFPLDQIHPQARKAAEAARCAGDQGKFWEMHDVLFQNQRELGPDKLKEYARTLALDGGAFAECLDKGKHATGVQRNYDEGINAGVRGTPSFFVGRTRQDGTVEGLLINGARPLNDFKQEIERLLAEK